MNDFRAGDPIEDVQAGFSSLDDAALAHDGQVLGEVCLQESGLLEQEGNWFFPGAKQVNNLDSLGIGQRLANLGVKFIYLFHSLYNYKLAETELSRI